MSVTTATGRILITKIPAGEAPEEIRVAWVGLILPCEPIVGYPQSDEAGVLTDKKVRKRYCFAVPQEAAIEILEKRSPIAARWWRERGFPQSGMNFSFGELEAQVISGVTYQRIIHISEMDPGVNDRFFQD